MRANRPLILTVLASCVLAAAGCGSDDDSAGGPTASSGPTCNLTELAKLPPDEQQKELLAGAQKEGSALLYTTSNDDVIDTWTKGFEAAYPGVKLKSFAIDTDAMVNRITTEESAGKHVFDVLVNGAVQVATLHERDLLAENPGAIGIPEGFDKRFYGTYWGAFELLPTVIAWNTDLVDDADAPQTYEDLLDPKWKGKVSFDAEANQFVSGMLTEWGYDKTKQYVTDLVIGNEAQIRDGHTVQTQLLAAGDYEVSTELFSYAVESLIDEGAPLNWTAPAPIPTPITATAISKSAPHPCAAALAFAYILSKDGSAAMQDTGRVSTHTDIEPIFPRQAALAKSPDLALVTPDNSGGDLPAQTLEIEKIASSRATG